MRIAFTSYEYPSETGGGGIGTYLQTVAPLIHSLGHSVVVFTASNRGAAFWENEFVFRIPASNWREFDTVLPDYFSVEHRTKKFDVLEATDFQAAGLSVKKMFPNLPTVVRLHTPLYLVDKLLYQPPSNVSKLRMIFGAIRRLKKPTKTAPPLPNNYQREFDLVRLAERVSAPSISIAKELKTLGFQVDGKVDIVPLPFDSIPFCKVTSREDVFTSPHIVFVGRMEIRKGVIDLAAAIPLILKKIPNAKFSFIGQAAESPRKGMNMQDYLKRILENCHKSISFLGQVPRSMLVQHFADGDIFVFPSHYESFGLACCEAMAAGKAVVASRNGGMSEIIEQGVSGLLIYPKTPEQLSAEVIRLSCNNQLRLTLGRAARERIKTLLSPEAVIQKQLTCYQYAIEGHNHENSKKA